MASESDFVTFADLTVLLGAEDNIDIQNVDVTSTGEVIVQSEVTTVTIVSIIVALKTLFGFLFGDGHAGSCGAFRDAYFDVIAASQPAADLFNTNASIFLSAGPFNDLNHNYIVDEFLKFVVTAQDTSQQLFDKYKGRNLLGTTMFNSRYMNWLDRFLLVPMLFHTNDWTWNWFQDVGPRLKNLEVCCETERQTNMRQDQSISDLQVLTSVIPAMQQTLDFHQSALEQIQNNDLPFLQKEISDLENFVLFNHDPRILALEQRVFGSLVGELEAIRTTNAQQQQQIDQIKATYAKLSDLSQVRQELIARIDATKAALIQRDADIVATLRNEIAQESRFLQAEMARLDRELEARIQQQINSLAQRVTTLETRLNQLQQQTIPSLQTQIRDLKIESRNADARLEQMMNSSIAQLRSALQQQIDGHTARLNQLQQQTIPSLQTQIRDLKIESRQADAAIRQRIDTEIGRLQQQIDLIEDVQLPNLQQQILTNRQLQQLDDAALRQELLSQQEQIRTNLQTQIDGHTARLNQLQQQTIPSLQTQIRDLTLESRQADAAIRAQHQADITALRQADITLNQRRQQADIELAAQLRREWQQQLQGLESQLSQVDAALQAQINVLRQQILDLTMQLQQNVSQRVLQLEAWRAQVVDPALLRLQRQIGIIDQSIQDDILPRMQACCDLGADTREIVINNHGPRITILEGSVTNITNIELPDIRNEISNIQTTIINIDKRIVQIIEANCATVLACLADMPEEEEEGLCAFGRRAWGIMAECWLNENTLASAQEIFLPAEDVVPFSFTFDLARTDDEDPEHRLFQVLLETYDYLKVIEDEEDVGFEPNITADPISTDFVLQEVAGVA